MFIQVKNLTKTFNNNPAVSDISFDIKKNQTVGLLGPNGCGKTTSIGMMLGLIKPSGGEIIIDNKNLNKEKGMVFYQKLILHLLILSFQKN